MTIPDNMYGTDDSSSYSIGQSQYFTRVRLNEDQVVGGSALSVSDDADSNPTVINLDSGLWHVAALVHVFAPSASHVGLALARTDSIIDDNTQNGAVDEYLGLVEALTPGTSSPTTPVITDRVVQLSRVVDGDKNPEVAFFARAIGLPLGYAEVRWSSFFVSAVPGPTSVHARYASSTDQSVSASTDTLVAFGTDAETHPWISKATQGAGHRFTFEKGGIWAVTATTRFKSGGGAGERYSALVSDNGGSADVITAQGGYNGSTPETMNLHYTGYFPEDSYVEVSAWQNGGSSLDLEGENSWKNITFALVQPDA